jgi:hypothetical protein
VGIFAALYLERHVLPGGLLLHQPHC